MQHFKLIGNQNSNNSDKKNRIVWNKRLGKMNFSSNKTATADIEIEEFLQNNIFEIEEQLNKLLLKSISD